MAATPKTATLEFTPRNGGDKLIYSIYNSDVSGAFVRWNRMGTATATSVDFVTAPCDMILTDVSSVTGIADTNILLLFVGDGAVAGKLISWANTVNSLQNRSFPEIRIGKGAKLQLQSAV